MASGVNVVTLDQLAKLRGTTLNRAMAEAKVGKESGPGGARPEVRGPRVDTLAPETPGPTA
jgi:hypothetical protein